MSFYSDPNIHVPLRKPGSENDPNEDLDDDELKYPEIVTWPNHRDSEEKFKNFKNQEKGYSMKTVVITVVPMVVFTIAIVAVIIYLLCQRKTKQEKYMQYANRQNVRTFSNPNYNASGADASSGNPQQDKKSFIWKRLKYDSSQVCSKIFKNYIYVCIRSLFFFVSLLKSCVIEVQIYDVISAVKISD